MRIGSTEATHVMTRPQICIIVQSIRCTLNSYLRRCQVTGQKLGLDPQTMIDVMNVGTGANFTTKHSQKDLKSYDSGYQLDILVKDVKIAKDVIEKSGFETELPALVERYLEESLQVVERGADHAESLKNWEHRAGVVLNKTEQREGRPS